MTRRNILIGCGVVVVLGVLVFIALLVGIIIGGGGSKQSATSPAPEPASTTPEEAKPAQKRRMSLSKPRSAWGRQPRCAIATSW